MNRPYCIGKIKNETMYKYFSFINSNNSINNNNRIKKRQKLYLIPINKDNNKKINLN